MSVCGGGGENGNEEGEHDGQGRYITWNTSLLFYNRTLLAHHSARSKAGLALTCKDFQASNPEGPPEAHVRMTWRAQTNTWGDDCVVHSLGARAT